MFSLFLRRWLLQSSRLPAYKYDYISKALKPFHIRRFIGFVGFGILVQLCYCLKCTKVLPLVWHKSLVFKLPSYNSIHLSIILPIGWMVKAVTSVYGIFSMSFGCFKPDFQTAWVTYVLRSRLHVLTSNVSAERVSHSLWFYATNTCNSCFVCIIHLISWINQQKYILLILIHLPFTNLMGEECWLGAWETLWPC